MSKYMFGLIAVSLLLPNVSAIAAPQQQDRLSPLARPLFQKVSLILDPKADAYTGQTQIELTLNKASHSFEISGKDYQMTQASLHGAQACELSYKSMPLGKVQLSCSERLKAGKYVLNIAFEAPFNRRSAGLYKTVSQEKPYLFTQFEMSDARRAFPVFDEPSHKISYQLEITAPQSQRVFSNTPEIKTTTLDNLTTHTFAKTRPLPSYLLALAVGPLETVPVKGLSVPGRIITPANKSHMSNYALKQTPIILDFLEDYFDRAYPYSKLDQIAVPEFSHGAMENAGLITYREALLLHDPHEKMTQASQKSSTNVIAHEISHHWFGNLVTMKWWDDLWLNEAFATWVTRKTLTQVFPELDSAFDLPQNYAMVQDARLSTRPIRKPIHSEADIMDGLGLAYSKGSAILAMIENWIGEEAFQTGVRAYLKKHAFKNATAQDLWTALENSSQQPVSKVLRSYLNQSSFPLIDFKIDGKTLRMEQRRFVNLGIEAPAQTWTVPLVLKYGRGEEVKTLKWVLDKPLDQATLAFEPEWIYPDVNAMGYYRWKLPTSQFKQLLHRTEEKLSARERMALTAASNDLLKSGNLSGADWLHLMTLTLEDSEPKVVVRAWNYLFGADTYIDEQHKPLWNQFLTARAKMLLKKIGRAQTKEEPVAYRTLRARLYETLALKEQTPWILKAANTHIDDYLKGNYQGDPYLLDSFLIIAAYYGDADRLNAYQKAFETPTSARQRAELLYAMGFFKVPELQKKTLNYLLTSSITASDLGAAAAGQSFEKERRARFRGWLKANFADFTAKLPSYQVPRMPYKLVSGCSEDDLKESVFFKPLLKETPAYAIHLRKAQEGVQNCIILKKKLQPDFKVYLTTRTN